MEFIDSGWPDDDFLLADGFEDAFIGVVYGKSRRPVACYNRTECISILVGRGMTVEEAEEYFSFNVDDAWVGETTPMFLVPDLSRSGTGPLFNVSNDVDNHT